MRKSYGNLIAFLQGLSGVLMLVMLGVVLLGVTFRYVIDSALSWYDEFAGYVLVWLTMFGTVVALAKGKHISFETLVEKLPSGWQRSTEIFSTVCVLGFSLVMLVSGWVLVRSMWGETSVSVPSVDMSWVYSVLPISGLLLVLVGIMQLTMLVTGR
ncbi:MAG TPA: TRAP transporter small permease, partial [Candidatus Acidoferrum sp.]|nr:TRAP transporter small permease [Candidatus Acidoferrum sp.]